MKKKIMSLLLIVCLVVTMIPFATMEANAATSLTNKKVYRISDYKSQDCLLSANVCMMRRAAITRGAKNWSAITNTSARKKLCTGVNNMRSGYTYTSSGLTFKGGSGSLPNTKNGNKKNLISLLKSHPEGIVVYGTDKDGSPHGVLITSYSNGVFYCADSTQNYGAANKGIVKYSASTMTSLSNCYKYWYLKSVAGKVTSSQPTYTVKYSANGGTGTMSSATATLGKYYSSKSNTFKKTGHSFGGWYVKKNNKYWLVKSGSSWKWSTGASNKKVYSNKYKFMFYGSGSTNHKVNKGDTITLYARWVPETYSIAYNANGGSKAPSSQKKTYGKTLTLSSLKPVRSGYEFAGWSTSKSASTAQYKPGTKYTANKAVTLYAVWKKVVSEDAGYENNDDNSGSSNSAGSFLVTADEYESAYKGNSNYAATPMYRYATRSKLTTSSGKDTVSGYTKYDTKTTTSTSGYKFGTPITTSTAYTSTSKVTKSAVNKGYYYYIYTVAAPSKTSDWTYYGARSRSSVISYMKQNFSASSAWGESRLRYFWYISSTDLGSTSAKLNKSVPYCEESTVGVGTTSKSGTHLMDLKMYKYSRCYKVKTVTTTNYFYKWTGWSAWSAWTPEYKSASDTVKRDTQVMYMIQAK